MTRAISGSPMIPNGLFLNGSRMTTDDLTITMGQTVTNKDTGTFEASAPARDAALAAMDKP